MPVDLCLPTIGLEAIMTMPTLVLDHIIGMHNETWFPSSLFSTQLGPVPAISWPAAQYK